VEYEDAKRDGKSQLNDALSQINDGQASYESAVADLNAKIAEYNAATDQLRAEEAKLDPSMPGYDEAIKAIKAKWDTLLETSAALDAARAELESKHTELENATQTYNNGVDSYNQQVADGAQAISDAEKDLEEGRQKLEDGKKEIEDKKVDLEDAKKKIADKSKELDQAKEDVRNLKDKSYNWTLFSRAENGGVISISSFVDIAGRLRTSMASLFVLVGLFVCYAAIGRLVREQVRQIGTKKALGMRASEVTLSFLLYANATVVLGMFFGSIAAVVVVERIIVPVLSSSFFMSVPAWWSLAHVALFGLVELVLITASTMLACHSVLSHHAVELLAGDTPPSGKERFFENWALWKRLPLYTQTTINNLLNDKRRVLSTLVGVAGCTALVVCAITLNDDVVAGVGRQYTDVYHYDALVRVNMDESNALEKAADAVAKLGCKDSTPVGTRMVSLSLPDGTTSAATITVPQDTEDFRQLVTLISIAGDTAGQEVQPGDDGVWVSSAYAEHYGAKPGDKLSITLGDGTSYELPIAGFFKHYLVGHQIIMSPKLYQQIFNVEPTISKLFVRTGDKVSADELKEKLTDSSFVSSVANDREDQETLFNSFRKVSRVVVLVYLALSIAMAVVVLLNLNVMFVEEKRRDLITLMVCGYTVRDAKRYIWRDNLVLTVLGIIVGIALGMAAGYFAVMSMEISTVTLVKAPVLRACLAGAAASAVLSAIMTLISLRSIPRLKLADINRL
ncbi:MAG: ABC transporter permease, partial [Coriobacteriales bacterium]|nr:ABC transporter permease [Coriobacteriales bacterium]